MVSKAKKEKNREKKSNLTVELAQQLGGDKSDIQLVADVDENSDSDFETENQEFDFNTDSVRKTEIKDFIEQLEIFKYRPQPLSDDEDDDDEEDGENEDVGDSDDSPAIESDSPKKSEVKKEEKKKLEKEKKKLEKEKKSQKESSLQKPEASTSTAGTQDGKKKKRNKYKVQHEEISSTTSDAAGNQKDATTPGPSGSSGRWEHHAHVRSYQPRRFLLVKAGSDCFDPAETPSSESERVSDKMVSEMEKFAAKLLQDEISVFNKQKESAKHSDVGWMKTVLTSGTLADKIAALTTLVQESPLHNLSHLDTLIAMVKKKAKRESLQALDALKELFMTELLPDDRKLKTFATRPFSTVAATAGWNKDSIDKKLLMWYFEEQLKNKYAQFVNTLETLSHDPLVATKQKSISAMFHLLADKPEQEKMLLDQLINKIGDTSHKLASTVSHFLIRLVEKHPNMKNVVVKQIEQLMFRPNISERAQYYSVCFLNQLRYSHNEPDLPSKVIHMYFSFFKGFVKKGEVDSKMMSALLSGVNRAYPFASLSENFMSEQLDHLYKIVHIVNFNTSLQALMLLCQVMNSSQSVSERYYVALYKKMLDPALKSSAKQAIFLNLLFKSMKKDDSEKRVKAFLKRLLQVCQYQQPPFVCGALMLVSEVLKIKPGLLSITQVEEESDEEEHFVDEMEDDEVIVKQEPSLGGAGKQGTKKASWVHRKNVNHNMDSVHYEPHHRNPLYCHADQECIWELEKLESHFHPSVALFAQKVLKGQHITYTGDPLQDFTLIRFLDRFVYKNPKKQQAVVEKVATLSKRKAVPKGIKSIVVNTDQFLRLREEKIPVDDIFFYRYFQQMKEMGKKKKKKQEDEEGSDVSDSEFDEFLDKYEEQFSGADMADFDFDFASDMGKKKKGKKKGADDDDDEEESSDEDSGDDLDDNLSDEEVEFDQEEFEQMLKERMDADGDGEDDEDEKDEGDSDQDDGIGFNEEDIDFSDDDDDDELQELKPKKQQKRKAQSDKGSAKGAKKARKEKSMQSDLFSAAEEFGSVMDENVGSKLNMIGAEAMANKDKADVKQLKWEEDRNRWLKGDNWKTKKGNNFGKKKQGLNKPGSFSKKSGVQSKKKGNFSKKPGKSSKKSSFKGKAGRRK